MSSMPEPEVIIYTDGACKGNPGPGGWGVLMISGENRRELCGGEAATTNNRMELTAAIEALRALKTSFIVARFGGVLLPTARSMARTIAVASAPFLLVR